MAGNVVNITLTARKKRERKKKNDPAVVDFFEGGMFDVSVRCSPFYMHIRQHTHTFLDSRIFMKMYNVPRDERQCEAEMYVCWNY